MASEKTENAIKSMVRAAIEEERIYPSFFSIFHGQATISSAIRLARKRGLLVASDTTGGGSPSYVAGNISAHEKIQYLAS